MASSHHLSRKLSFLVNNEVAKIIHIILWLSAIGNNWEANFSLNSLIVIQNMYPLDAPQELEIREDSVYKYYSFF